MTVTRSVVMIVLMLLMTFVLVLIHAKDVTTLEYDDLLPATETNARQPNDTDATVGDHRQGRMSLHAELPSSKAKREQALRNILAARRRQILSQRPFEAPRNLNRTPRPGESTLKDSADILEAQETRHGMYVTAPVDIEAGTSNEEESSEISSRVVTKIVPELNKDLGMEFVSKGIEKQVVEQSSMNPNSENDMAPSVENKSASTRNNHSISHRNFSSSSLASSSVVGSNQKSSEMDNRKKNTVSMSESLYNYFRPVESNIPMEDMSQFLYFGQKIQPEIHNTTGNNSVDVTPTVPTVLSSRRRYSMKRFSTTTPVPVPRLEEIINEEMNIAVERQIVEKNKISKIKNTFRSPESGLYYRKTRPTDPTIASNIIPIRELTRNSTETDARTDSPSDKFRDGNPSAHATIQEQLQHERGSATHVLAETRNATNSTQIPHQQPVSANMYEESIVESEISIKDRSVGTSKYTIPTSRVESLKASIDHRGRRKTDNSSIIEAEAPRVENEAKSSIGEATLESNDSAMNMEMHGDYSEQRLMRANVHGTSSFNFSKNIETVQADPPSSSSRESNNIETSTSRDKIPRSTLASFPISWTTSTDTSTLRIIVTEENLTQSSKISTEVEKYTVKPVDSTEQRVRDVASGEIPPPSSSVTTTAASITNSISSESPTLEVTTAGQRKNRQDQQRQNVDQEQHLRHQEQQQQQQQQHVYAYTITNVTRLLRNYTGPGLSREEQGGSQRSTGTAEITTGSPQRRQPPPPSLLLLPRTGSGIEAARAPAELSAGTTVEAVAAGGASAGNLVGERQRKVVAVAPQSQQRAPNRTSLQLTVNKSTSRSNRPTEVTTRGAVRWNHTKVRNSDLEGLNDRRFLRKSASAVLNQRIGANVEEDGSVTSKRRRVTNGLFASSVNSRRIKGTGLFKNREVSSSDRSIDGSSLNSERTNLENKGEVEDVVERQNIQDTMHLGEMTPETEITTVENIMANMEETINTSVASNVTGEVIDVTTPSVVADMLYGDRSNTTESTNLNDEYLKSNTKDKNDVVQNESESAAVSENASSNSRASSADKSTDNTSGSSTVTVTATVETIVAKETTPTATTMPTPVFPVTPKIITEAARVPIEKETFTLKSTESVNRVMETKTTESSKSLEIDNLDPSEIQRQYRPKNVTTETPAVSTTEIENTVSPQDQSTISNSQVEELESSTIFSSTEPRKRISGERSPEVRARNLSDKSKDKDDILPIMHLYNTSDIFNGNGSMDSFSRGTERRVELPVNSQPEVQRTTEKTNDTVTAKSSTKESTNSSRVPLSDTVRKEKHADNRDVPSQVPPTGPGRGSSFVNGNGNRTRHRPVYHHAILPDYNNSLYPNDLNRTFFETGLISVSPRESVNISEVISKRHDGDAIASQETVAVVSYILATLVVFPIAVGVGLILRRLILRNRKVLEESDTSSEISCRKDALNLENGDFKTSIEKAITKLPRIQHLCHEAEKPPPPSSQESRWEFPRDKLRLQTVLGQGNFGQVWKAEADDLTGHQGTTRLVAVKTVKEGASDREKEDLVRELEIMQQLGSHPNVVTLLGCCTEQEPHYLILEYVMYGKLLAYLRDHRTRQDFYNFSEDSAALTSRDLTVFGYCVARGMEYLASKKIIHRDLAARNVLVDHNKLCKIADFGMSRFANEDGEVIETRQGRNALPIRWMAPESLIYSLFTMKTDVWSFGILMWEIVTLGSTPYPDMTAKEVMRNVQNGYRLERPSHCRSELFRVISRCWHADPDRRPEFQTLRRDLTQLLEDNMNGHYVDLESFASECTD